MPEGAWMPLLLTAEARALFIERSLFATTEPRPVPAATSSASTTTAAAAAAAAAAAPSSTSPAASDGTPAPAAAVAAAVAVTAAEEDDPSRRPVICCDLRLVDTLASMAAPEPWGLHNWCLQTLLRETFSRLIQQSRVLAFYPAGTNDPTALLFHTSLTSPTLAPIYALVVPSASRVRTMAPMRACV
jgi:hypothetical protein